MSYHLKPIEKGVFGEFSKIKEEFLEAEDGIAQGNPLLVLNELADLIGAIEAYAAKYHCSLDDLIKMMEATKRAFQSGRRSTNEKFDPSKVKTMSSPESWKEEFERKVIPKKKPKPIRMPIYYPHSDPSNGYIEGMGGLRDLETGRELYPDT